MIVINIRCSGQNDRLVQAELSLRYWQDHNNLFIWCPIPLFTGRNDFRAMELALIQEWQPKLNFPFICQFYHPRKGLLKKPQMNMNAQFGLATLWRRARHRFTPKIVKDIMHPFRQIPEPPHDVEAYPFSWIQHTVSVRYHSIPSIHRRGIDYVLCPPTPGPEHTRTFSFPGSPGN